MTKRTYSRRTLTIASSDDNDGGKRRRPNSQTTARTQSQNKASTSSSSRPTMGEPKKKRSRGPISIPVDDTDMDCNDDGESTVKAKPRPKLAKNILHAGREALDSLMGMSKKPALHIAGNEANTLNLTEQADEAADIAAAKHTSSKSCAEALSSVKEKTYLAPEPTAPARDLYGKRIGKGSQEAQLWSENQANSRLLRLPSEVRNRIYEFALGGNTIHINFQTYEIERNGRSWEPPTCITPVFKYYAEVDNVRHRAFRRVLPPKTRRSKGMALLNGVCRQLYLETSTLPYQLNNIAFKSYNVMFNFLVMEHRLTLKQREVITELSVFDKLPAPNILAMLPNLQRVRVEGYEAKQELWRVEDHEQGKRLVEEEAHWWLRN